MSLDYPTTASCPICEKRIDLNATDAGHGPDAYHGKPGQETHNQCVPWALYQLDNDPATYGDDAGRFIVVTEDGDGEITKPMDEAEAHLIVELHNKYMTEPEKRAALSAHIDAILQAEGSRMAKGIEALMTILEGKD